MDVGHEDGGGGREKNRQPADVQEEESVQVISSSRELFLIYRRSFLGAVPEPAAPTNRFVGAVPE